MAREQDPQDPHEIHVARLQRMLQRLQEMDELRGPTFHRTAEQAAIVYAIEVLQGDQDVTP